MDTSTKAEIVLGVLATAAAGYAVYEMRRQKSLNVFTGTDFKKIRVKPVSDEVALGLAIAAGSANGLAVCAGHKILPFFGGITAGLLTDESINCNYQLKYAKEKHPLLYLASLFAVSIAITAHNIKTPTTGMERSHWFPKKLGFDSYKHPLNVSSVPIWFHNLTDRNRSRWAKNTVALIFRAPPPWQAESVALSQNPHSKRAIVQFKKYVSRKIFGNVSI